MNIYVCGCINGKDHQSIIDRYNEAKELFAYLDWDVVTPIISTEPFIVQELPERIKTMLSCDAVYIIKDWMDDCDARIEHYASHERGMKVLYEEYLEQVNTVVSIIVRAIRKVTGLALLDYSTPRRHKNLFFARMLFVHFCSLYEVKVMEISNYINRDHSTIFYMMKKYDDEYMFNKAFALMADEVEFIIKKFLNKDVL